MAKLQRIRQGDIVLVRKRRLPREARRRSEDWLRVPGEDGHVHLLRGAKLFEDNGQALALVAKGTTAVLEHGEHDQQIVPPGVWELRTAEEYEPELEPAETSQEQAKVRPYAD